MVERAENLIGQYLADLLVPAEHPPDPADEAEKGAVESATLPAPMANVAADVPIKDSVHAPSISAEPVSPGVLQLASPLAQTTTPKEVALAEPARQQLQQLLNSAWPAVAPAPVITATATALKLESYESAVETKQSNPGSTETLTPKPIQTAPAISIPVAIPSTGKPDWANKAFDTLIVDVAGLKLAIPLVVLGQIFQVTEAFSHLPGQGPLFLGTLNTARGPLRVINTALLVMPERYENQFIDEVRFVVSLAGASSPEDSWQLALAVNRVAQPVNIACEDVVWRGERSKRPWLLGTVKSQMCALLDVTVIGQYLSGPH